MSGTTAGPDSMDSTRQLPPTEGAECEVRLRHVLAYISEKRHRRWTAFTAVFLLIYYVSSIPFNSFLMFASDALALAGIGYSDIFSPGTLGLVLFTTSLPSLIITIVIISRLRKAYRG